MLVFDICLHEVIAGRAGIITLFQNNVMQNRQSLLTLDNLVPRPKIEGVKLTSS